jgi:threonine aldolase
VNKIDFRSDTVSWPTEAMRRAMATAVVGDDVYGEDPTVIALEQLAARRVGKEAALFVASGTMGNLISMLAHANRGDEAIVGQDAHIYCWEAGGLAALGGIIPHPLPTDRYGRLNPAQVETAVRGDDPHWPRSRLLLLENSCGAKNGYPLPPDYFAEMGAIARQHGLKLHLDGARLFNAAVAQGLDAAELTRQVDSLSFCLSKGLCAPVGSLVCGTAEFIHEARRMRKIVGGGMRQAGVLAAAGIVALEEMVERLADDHAHARQLAAGLAALPGVAVELEMIRTNIIFFRLTDDVPLTAAQIIAQLRQDNIWLGDDGPRQFRAVTHYWVGPNEVERLLASLRRILEGA